MASAPIDAFWRRAAAAAGLDAASTAPEAWSFADTPALADGLLGAVIAGVKTGTSTSLAELEADGDPVPQAGELSILLDGAGIPRALIRTTSVTICAFDDVDAGFAASEGEDDLSLTAWREGHAAYFARVLERRGMAIGQLGALPLVLERFELLYSEIRDAFPGVPDGAPATSAAR